MKCFELDINGFCWESNVADVPEKAGIYFVYACYYGERDKKWYSGELVYIGEAEQLKTRINQHANPIKEDDNLHIDLPQVYRRLWYTYAFFEGNKDDRLLCEAALIFKHKPLKNNAHKSHFGSKYDVNIVLRGETRNLVTTYSLEADER